MTQIVTKLPPVQASAKAAILSSERTTEAHRAHMASIPAMTAIEVGGAAQMAELPAQMRVGAWNLERCLFPEASADLMRTQGLDLVLLSEVDNGMARTKQRHTTAVMADALGMSYAYGVEFFEMGLGSPYEVELAEDDFNALGWHGNAILSKAPFEALQLLRLDDHGHWFSAAHGADVGQPRIGGRMAILAIVPTENGPICAVSTHLESNSGAEHRAAQFRALMDAVDAFAPGMPVVIGGDLNSGNHLPPEFRWQDETLFDDAVKRNYSWAATPDGTTTRPSLITRHPDRKMKLDWLATRDLKIGEKANVPALDPEATPLSDHELIVAQLDRPA